MTDSDVNGPTTDEGATRPRLLDIAIGLIWGKFLQAANEPAYLLVVGRRAEGVDLAGYDEFPGGKVEAGETPEQAVQRECLEETGLPVRSPRVRLRVDHTYESKALRLWFFDCDVDGDPDALIPSAPFQWLEVAKALQLRFPAGNQVLLESLRSVPRPLGVERPDPLGSHGQFVDP